MPANSKGAIVKCASLLITTSLLIFQTANSMCAQEIDVWLGTSSAKPSQGIYHCLLDTQQGRLGPSKLVAEITGPGFLALHPTGELLYAVGSLANEPSVAAFEITGRGAEANLRLINALPIGDGGAAHVSISKNGRTLLTAQYGGGSVAAFLVNVDGSLEKQTQLIQHQGGSGAVAGRQDASHAHWTGFSPDQRFAFVPDLGLDQVVIYQVDTASAVLSPHGFGAVPSGAGPRHMKFHPNGNWIYVLNELDLSVSVFRWDNKNGTMELLQTLPTVPKEELAKEQFSSCSEIRVHPTGNFVYAANRGHDTVTVFQVQSDGLLQVIQNENVRGATPRNINLDPAGKWLLAAGQDSHSLACFAIDQNTGSITFNRSVISTPAPICVVMEGSQP